MKYQYTNHPNEKKSYANRTTYKKIVYLPKRTFDSTQQTDNVLTRAIICACYKKQPCENLLSSFTLQKSQIYSEDSIIPEFMKDFSLPMKNSLHISPREFKKNSNPSWYADAKPNASKLCEFSLEKLANLEEEKIKYNQNGLAFKKVDISSLFEGNNIELLPLPINVIDLSTLEAKLITNSVMWENRKADDCKEKESITEFENIQKKIKSEYETSFLDKPSENIFSFATDDTIPEDTKAWYYKDLQGNVHGPFSSFEMNMWFNAGYFPDDLLIRFGDDKEFITLIELLKAIIPEPESHTCKFLDELSEESTHK